MSPLREILEIARRELLERWRSRTMRISFGILIALVVAAAVAAAISDEGKPTDDFGLVGPRAAALAPALRLATRPTSARRASIASATAPQPSGPCWTAKWTSRSSTAGCW